MIIIIVIFLIPPTAVLFHSYRVRDSLAYYFTENSKKNMKRVK